ncbi:hypothetical protein TVAG_474370 [Trichomonas vaginalis G3]|uniref:Uncharacterized protein n=1 Tax=Trichomonas vaginalis (strain ATCC PRA-98 / G3) TaxID=412133 RepID=A2ESX3_TRIV3|nr:hypothetical protein TVAGG3_0191800 [Trichomonas vaginalis G3]EAY04231.1 hypothetical protein TVAG_474370 [Trichomonas vaginalis G3]KAI5550028.1 hypothetical protein TVAGG3_0191800 [Trichomonas vaginalis G3]|eukprot:XP_001316454.1 hypothetical protein [Trichomonas vaginalis G3]
MKPNSGESPPIPQLNIKKKKTPSSIDYYIAEFEANGTLPPPWMKNEILQTLTRRRIDASNDARYLEAAKFHDTYKKLRNAFLNEKTAQTKIITTTRNPDGNISEIQSKKQALDRQYKIKREKLEAKKEKVLQKTAEKHWKEIQEFKVWWAKPESLIHFAKPSNQLQNLRVRERKQAIICDYEGASKTKKIADELEKKETKTAQENARRSMKIQYNQIVSRHNLEIEGIEHHYSRKLIELDKSYREGVERLELSLRWQKVELEEQNRKINYISTYTNATVLYPSIFDEESDVALTPRTSAKVHSHRTKTRSDLLQLQGIELSD